ncbi:hypothetical protein F5Y01DRAFT_275769 [Xylaria sp. FL0043]|nr:hypothetical protein F5Y01DRAFT_275769 [Xylaria sp. FL0043]
MVHLGFQTWPRLFCRIIALFMSFPLPSSLSPTCRQNTSSQLAGSPPTSLNMSKLLRRDSSLPVTQTRPHRQLSNRLTAHRLRNGNVRTVAEGAASCPTLYVLVTLISPRVRLSSVSPWFSPTNGSSPHPWL